MNRIGGFSFTMFHVLFPSQASKLEDFLPVQYITNASPLQYQGYLP